MTEAEEFYIAQATLLLTKMEDQYGGNNIVCIAILGNAFTRLGVKMWGVDRFMQRLEDMSYYLEEEERE